MKNRKFFSVLAFCLAMLVLSGTLSLFVFADGDSGFSGSYDISVSSVEEDLALTFIDGKRFDEAEYPLDKDADYMMLLNLVEYGFEEEDKSSYGLYFYIYNPSGMVIRFFGQHSVQLSLRENSAYRKIGLDLLDHSDDWRFLKFKLATLNFGGKKIYDQVDAAKRDYFIGGIEIDSIIKGVVDYNIAGSYSFTGYRSKNSLSCKRDQILTISLDLHSTQYRTKTSSEGKYYQNQLDSVYFALDNYLMETFGEVYAIHFSYTEKRIDGVVTTNEAAYNAILPYILSQKFLWDYSGWSDAYLEGLPWGFGANVSGSILGVPGSIADYAYNIGCPGIYRPDPAFWFFKYIPGTDLQSLIDGKIAISGEELSEWYDTYGLSDELLLNLDLTHMIIGDRKKEVDATLTVEDGFDMLSFSSNHNWLQELYFYGFFHGDLGEDVHIDSSIVPVRSSDLSGDASEVAEKLYVFSDDIPEMKETVSAAEAADQTVYLFRFNQQQYLSMPVYSYENLSRVEEDSYYFQENFYQDFDILDISFRDESGIVTVLPVVHSPETIFPDVQPPADIGTIFEEGSWQNFFRILGIILAVVLVVLIVYFIFKLVAAGRAAFGKNGGQGGRRRRK